jgi:hypothetical protein
LAAAEPDIDTAGEQRLLQLRPARQGGNFDLQPVFGENSDGDTNVERCVDPDVIDGFARVNRVERARRRYRARQI